MRSAIGIPIKRPWCLIPRNVLARLAKDSSLLKGICAVDSCPYATLCRGGCRAVAAAYADGDLLAGMPYCLTRVLDELET